MTSLDKLSGLVAVVTGAGSGIGRALAIETAARGMKVLAVDVSEERLREVAEAICVEGGQVTTAVVDISDFDAVERMAAESRAENGAAALIVNNAGIEFTGAMWEMRPASWKKLLDVNVNGAFNVIRAFLPDLLASTQEGHVVMLSSVGGLSIGPGQSAYITSKFAMRVMAQCLREELRLIEAPVGVTVVLPGPVRTNIFRDAATSGTEGPAQRDQMVDLLGNHGIDPAEVAHAVHTAIEADRFWLHTHPSMSRDAVAAQYDELLSALPL